jgi:hypothetical protein
MAHIHKAIPSKSRNRGWVHCVTPELCAADPWRQAAHGNIVRDDVCSCGATRETEINGFHKNYGPWEMDVRNPAEPSRRVKKALAKYVRKEIGLPTEYTPAKVRVDSKGEIDIKFARPPKGQTRNPRQFSVKVKGRR